MSENYGILYAVQNELWLGNIKCGLTTQKIEKRISNLQTSLFKDCEIIATTDKLVNCRMYEFLLKKILKEYRVRTDREFFNIETDMIQEIYKTFNYMNSILDTPNKLNNYILNNYPEYFKNRKYVKSESSSSDKPKRKKQRKGLFVDTSNLE